MAKPKILFVSTGLNSGGAEKALISILQSLDYSKFEVTLILITRTGHFIQDAEAIQDLKVKSIIIPSRSKVIGLINRIKAKLIYKIIPSKKFGKYLCRNYDITVAFCEGQLTKWIGSSDDRSKKIAWVHTDMIKNDWPVVTGIFKSEEEEKSIYRNFDKTVAVSETVAEGMKEKYNISDIDTIFNILDKEIKQKSLEKITFPFNRKAKLQLTSIGRLEEVKGYDLLIEALKILINGKGLDINLCIVGDGSQKDKLNLLIERYGLSDKIRLVGSKANPYPYIAHSDVYVCSSRYEGFNIAILEAMTLGKPVITTECAGPKEISANGKFTLISKIESEDIANCIELLYHSPEKRSYLSSQSLKRSLTYSPEQQIKAIDRLFSSVLNS